VRAEPERGQNRDDRDEREQRTAPKRRRR
jgi:hypothetical protein